MIDLFSGLGGFHYAAQQVWPDIEVVTHCEIEPFCQKVLKKHWPDTPIHDDIITMKGDSFGPIDLLTGGFPCQPFSAAGKQGGSEDDRHLWPQMLRIIKEAKPRWIVGENVDNITGFVEFEDMLASLEAEGYEVQAFIIPACGVDAPHRRNRVWIVANTRYRPRRNIRSHKKRGNTQVERTAHNSSFGGSGKQSKIVANSPIPGLERTDATRATCPDECPLECSEILADAKSPGLQERKRELNGEKEQSGPGSGGMEHRGKAGTIWQPESGLGRVASRLPTWLDEPNIPRVAKGIKDRGNRLKALGNAIVPQVVMPIFQAIKTIDDELYREPE